MNSEFHQINFKDILHGLIVAGFGSMLQLFMNLLTTKGFDIHTSDIKSVILTGIVSMIAYLIKTFFTDDNNKFLGAC